MNNIIRISLRAAAAVLAVILASSCIFEKENPSAEGKVRRVMVQIGISTDGGMTTKAQGDAVATTPEDATNPENVVNTLRVYAYNADDGNKLCGYLHVDNVTGVSSSASKAYMMDLRIPYSQMSTSHNIVFRAVANAESISYTGNLDVEEIFRDFDGTTTFTENIAYTSFDAMMYEVSQNYGKYAEDGTTVLEAMPMYCQTDPIAINLSQTATSDKVAGNASEHTGHILTKIVPIKLTRPMAKIDVYAAEASTETASGDSDAGIQITSVQLVNPVAAGKLFPGTPSTPAQNATAAMNISTANVTKAVIADDNTKADLYTRVTSSYYIAENATGTAGKFSYGQTTADATLATEAAGATALKIGYKVSATAETEYGYVVMPPIARNTWYKVLARITANGEMALTLNVQEWDSGEIANVNFEDEVTLTKTSWTFGDGVENKNNTIVFSSASDLEATYNFTLNTPVGGTWYASLDGDIQNFVLETAGETEGSKITGKTVSGPITTGSSYVKIKTTSSNAEQGQKIATFKLIAKTANGDRTLTVKFDSTKESYTLVQNQ